MSLAQTHRLKREFRIPKVPEATASKAGRAFRESLPTLEIGKPVPLFRAQDQHSESHRMRDMAGRYVVLEWCNYQCPYSVKHYRAGTVPALQEELRAKGVIWFSVLSTAPGTLGYLSAEEVDDALASVGAKPSAVLMDPRGRLGCAYGALTTPHVFIVDPELNLSYRGAMDDEPSPHVERVVEANNFIREAFTDVYAERQIMRAVTRPYGSMIKYDY